MRLFLDCEFSSFDSPELISVALVGDGVEFYGEVSKIPKCSNFVNWHVIPQLSSNRETIYALKARLISWLNQFKDIQIVSDNPEWDLPLIRECIYGASLEKFEWNKKSRELAAEYFQGRRPHHALTDANAMRYAYDRLR